MKTKIAAALMILTAGSVLLAANTAGAAEIKASRHHGHMPPPREWREHHHDRRIPPHEWREHHHHDRHMPPHEFREPPHRGPHHLPHEWREYTHRRGPGPHRGEIGVPPRW